MLPEGSVTRDLHSVFVPPLCQTKFHTHTKLTGEFPNVIPVDIFPAARMPASLVQKLDKLMFYTKMRHLGVFPASPEIFRRVCKITKIDY